MKAISLLSKIIFFLIWCNLLVDLYCSGQNSEEYPIRLVVLAPGNETLPYALHKVVPAVIYAVQAISKENKQKIEVIYKDTRCSSAYGPIEAFNLYSSRLVDVFIGPICSYVIAPVARYACVWDIPLLTSDGRTDVFDKKDFPYSMITRMNGSFSQVAVFFLEVLKAFGWKVVALLYHDLEKTGRGHSDCHFALAPLYTSLGKLPFYINFDETLRYEDYVDMLKEISLNARVHYDLV
ncbi:atrial natriuretic peptide receptor 3-like [Argiope bruennichi]|uniref:atrial natriuretic peptide receptor 3-like n=1 Tax=Argiope bruennichi TaxID=94029 RepID=UPI0024941265|nr:atrial natriuretic peptide receptor 3-like [Argiope bruennichi]